MSSSSLATSAFPQPDIGGHEGVLASSARAAKECGSTRHRNAHARRRAWGAGCRPGVHADGWDVFPAGRALRDGLSQRQDTRAGANAGLGSAGRWVRCFVGVAPDIAAAELRGYRCGSCLTERHGLRRCRSPVGRLTADFCSRGGLHCSVTRSCSPREPAERAS